MEIGKTAPLTVRLEEGKIKYLKDLAIKKSLKDGEYFNHQDLVKKLINDFIESGKEI